MKMTTELATLAEAEEDIDDEDDEDDDDEDSNCAEDGSSSEICTFDVPHFRYIDDDDVEEIKEEEREGGWRGGSGRSCCSCSSEEACRGSSSYRYVVVSGTPLKILEHLLSDLRLDDQRGAPESRESGKFVVTHANTQLVSIVHRDRFVRGHPYTQCGCISIKR